MSIVNQPTLLDFVAAEMIAAGIARNPRVAGAAPPVFLHPRNGTPAPGESMGAAVEVGQDAVIALFHVAGVPTPPREKFRRVLGLDVRIRTRKAPLGIGIEQQLYDLFHDRRDYNLTVLIGAVSHTWRINESMQVRPLGNLGSDTSGFDFSCGFLFDVWNGGQPPATPPSP